MKIERQRHHASLMRKSKNRKDRIKYSNIYIWTLFPTQIILLLLYTNQFQLAMQIEHSFYCLIKFLKWQSLLLYKIICDLNYIEICHTIFQLIYLIEIKGRNEFFDFKFLLQIFWAIKKHSIIDDVIFEWWTISALINAIIYLIIFILDISRRFILNKYSYSSSFSI